jgi:hypothetical protein
MHPMKAHRVLIPAALCLVAGAIYLASDRKSEPSGTPSSAPDQRQPAESEPAGQRPLARPTTGARAGGSDRALATKPSPEGSDGDATAPLSSADLPVEGSAAGSETPPLPQNPGATVSREGAPSIGSVKVLGHPGCQTNTQGWFLSVGRPDQYEFSVSEDGETVEVTPNVPTPDGNFEFVHCADPGELIGKRVRFTAQIRAENVTGVAQLRLRSEDQHRNVIGRVETQAGGTHAMQEYAAEIDVTREASIFSYGVTFKSPGRLWISHPTVTTLSP